MGAMLISMTWKMVCKNYTTASITGINKLIPSLSGYPEFGKYLNETGRPIVYSCSWPAYWGDKIPNYPAIAKSCNLWRNYGDIQDSYDDVLDIVDHYGDHQKEFAQFAGPGQWNDPDMVRYYLLRLLKVRCV